MCIIQRKREEEGVFMCKSMCMCVCVCVWRSCYAAVNLVYIGSC